MIKNDREYTMISLSPKITFVITVMSWGPWRLKSPATPPFVQLFIQAHIKENIKGPRHLPLWGESTSQRASDAENVSIWLRHHGYGILHEDSRRKSQLIQRFYGLLFVNLDNLSNKQPSSRWNDTF